MGPEGERRIPRQVLYGSDGIHYLAKRLEEILTGIQVPERTGLAHDLSQAAPARVDRLPGPGSWRRLSWARATGSRRCGSSWAPSRWRRVVAPARRLSARQGPRSGDDRHGRGHRLQTGQAPGHTDLAYAWRKRMGAHRGGPGSCTEIAGLPTGDLPPVVA